MANQKLTIVSVDNFSQQIGNSEFAIFTVETETKEYLPVAVTYNALKARGINIELLDNLVGSTIIATRDTNIKTGVLTEASDRIRGIIDGTLINDDIESKKFGTPITILLLNRTNCQINKSSLYTNETKDLIMGTNAKVVVEEKKEKARQAELRGADRIRALANRGIAPVVAEVVEPTNVEAVLDTNEEDGEFKD
jgi:hypothetical protein